MWKTYLTVYFYLECSTKPVNVIVDYFLCQDMTLHIRLQGMWPQAAYHNHFTVQKSSWIGLNDADSDCKTLHFIVLKFIYITF